MRRRIVTAAALAFGLALGGCDSFDPLDKLADLDIMGTSKKPLLGERRPVFDQGDGRHQEVQQRCPENKRRPGARDAQDLGEQRTKDAQNWGLFDQYRDGPRRSNGGR